MNLKIRKISFDMHHDKVTNRWQNTDHVQFKMCYLQMDVSCFYLYNADAATAPAYSLDLQSFRFLSTVCLAIFPFFFFFSFGVQRAAERCLPVKRLLLKSIFYN